MGIHQPVAARHADSLRAWLERERRYKLHSVTTITTETGRSGAAHISNISNRGCRIATDLPIAVGQPLRLLVEPLGTVHAEIRWVIGKEAGLQFRARDPFSSDYEFTCDANPAASSPTDIFGAVEKWWTH